MSWLSGLTGKAEDLLNKLDKSAADAFFVDERPSASNLKHEPLASGSEHLVHSASSTYTSHYANLTGALDHRLAYSCSLVSTSSILCRTVSSVEATNITSSNFVDSSGKVKVSDDLLFDFLNSKETPPNVGKIGYTSINTTCHSRHSSNSSAYLTGQRALDASEGIEQNSTFDSVAAISQSSPITEANIGEHGVQRNSPTSSHDSADPEVLSDAMKESPASSENGAHVSTEHGKLDATFSTLQLENQLLKNEVVSLNQEMAVVAKQAKDVNFDVRRFQQEAIQHSSNSSQHDQLVREFQCREIDQLEAIKAKNSQIAVLRVQLEEFEQKLESSQRETKTLRSENDRILHDHRSASGIHSQTMDTMRNRMEELEGMLAREQQAHKQIQHEAAERYAQMQQDLKSLMDALNIAEKRVSDEKAKVVAASSQLRKVKTVMEATRQEMAEYKEKASRILQSKERLICSLREGVGLPESGDVSGTSPLEYDSVRQERDMLREELQRSKMAADSLRMEFQDLEVQMHHETSSAQDSIISLEENLTSEKHYRADLEQELLKQKQELNYAIEELQRQKVGFQTRITDREGEIEKLRNQLTTKSISTTSECELERRVRSLTESLIQKQTTLETLSTEKNSLTLQLERLEHQYREVENTLMRSTIVEACSMSHEDDVRQRLPTFMREGLTDTEVTRRVKRYVNSIDKFSIRLGVFLRRYPIARIFLIVYMAVVHVWVLVILMTYQPEIHGKDCAPT